MMLTAFSTFALVLAALGIYAVISYSVHQRIQEIGIRMALGESATQLQLRIMLQTLRLAVIGLVIGLSVSWIMTRALSGLLFGVTPNDPASFIGTATLLVLVAAAAGYFPARRASRIDPIAALRAN
jgi:ABC-type antimicrobial peptide transport system permease subunit